MERPDVGWLKAGASVGVEVAAELLAYITALEQERDKWIKRCYEDNERKEAAMETNEHLRSQLTEARESYQTEHELFVTQAGLLKNSYAERDRLRGVVDAAKALKEQVETVFVVNPHERIEGLGQIDALLARFDAALSALGEEESGATGQQVTETSPHVMTDAKAAEQYWNALTEARRLLEECNAMADAMNVTFGGIYSFKLHERIRAFLGES